ncbi:Zn2/Cys6 DNA-binding protein [Glarea lozoyensis ATCC 20868]|uniref:Zn2/Cys6 DNA-binding protein n=1 Tax=Glarea lozoyensis (strain ATCC 20868 / MF5171) TaxID=1116229 RepID=S3D007_GLAL2|nr:Zn2/Cys6 DNA-binding protein [Glarea lozoyensis ATCC 20868]EPE25396.1 Zn2/Cys6 DNA-binding protein [Glarea lozoyensis ATCC 20868]
MSGDNETEDPEVSDGASENEYSDQDPDLDVVKEGDDNSSMAEQKVKPETDENGKAVGGSTVTTTKPKLDPKDPLRPRRKKARRACFACQRAHLTCGDERPCQRCIKRGLADACQDGVRKKAKYLHDAPPEALRPVLGPNFNQVNNSRPNHAPPAPGNSTPDTSQGVSSGFFSQPDISPSYSLYTGQSNSMAPPLQSRLSYGPQQSPLSPDFQPRVSRQNSLQQNMPVQQVSNDVQGAFGGALFDPSNPALFNFDLEGLNFGNHYGALEFGMLGHMSSGAGEVEPKGSISSQGMESVNFNNSGVFGNGMDQFNPVYSQDMLPEFVGVERQNNSGQMFAHPIHHGPPHAYAIATGPTSLHSPSTDASPSASGMGFESSPTTFTTPAGTPLQQPAQHRPPRRNDSKPVLSQKFGPSSAVGKRTRDASSVYDTVHEPYPYTTGFHSLTAFLQRRFSPAKTLRIAKSLASIRPSFISCTKTLNRQDLIFMEKCFQRTLFEYDDFMLNCCTPTLVCRRTGEVAAVNKEFTMMTGWKKDVLLGYEANCNINTGKSADSGVNSSGPASLGNTGRAGLATPRMRPLTLAESQTKEGKPQPVFIAELMDDDSVIEFYEDFARLAFGDSRGSVTTRGKLLKYQTKESLEASPERSIKEEAKHHPPLNGGIGGMGGRVREIDGEHGIGTLERDGKMDFFALHMKNAISAIEGQEK